MSFFGFDTSMPGRPGQTQNQQPQGQAQGQGGFSGFANESNTAFGAFNNAGAEEDVAVYTWGESTALEEGGDAFNDETFGDVGPIQNDFNFGHAAPAASAPAPKSGKGKIASTQSRYGPKQTVDPFAFSEDDFYSSRRPTTSKTAKSAPKPKAPVTASRSAAPAQPPQASQAATGPVNGMWGQPQAPPTMWGASPAAAIKPSGPAAGALPNTRNAPPAPGQIKSLEEIEAEMSRLATSDNGPPPHDLPQSGSSPAPGMLPQQQPQQQGPQVLSLEEIERQMMGSDSAIASHSPAPPSLPTGHSPLPGPPGMPSFGQHQAPSMPSQAPGLAPPAREVTPPQIKLAGSGYASSQALLDSMFPELGTAAPSGTAGGSGTAEFPGVASQAPRPSPEELDRMQAIQERIAAKIAAMAEHNHLMGNSDKDFITRIQLSQLATADPYTSDFYAQVFSAIRGPRPGPEAQGQQGSANAGPGNGKNGNEGPKDIVQVAPGYAFGVSGPAGNRFGKMGQQTMQKLSTQVKKLVESRDLKYKNAQNAAALQGALGKINRGGVASGPKPVLAVPTVKAEHRPTNILNNQSGIHRAALTRKQIAFAIEDLYDRVLELEQVRRNIPPMEDQQAFAAWDQQCGAMVDGIWGRLMVMEPLDISNPHPFISLINSAKGQRLFPRLLRHLSHQQCLTLLTLLIATYPQLEVVARAPPPPVTDVSLLTKADRADRARREAETDSFLQWIVPGIDMLIQRCGLGLVGGLLGIVTQRMECWRVAATRVKLTYQPGVALFTALLSKAQNLIRVPTADPTNPQAPPPVDPQELDQWNKTYAYFLSTLLPHLPDLFPSTIAQRHAFGPGAYLMQGHSEAQALEMEKRDAEVWGFTAALAVNAPEEEQASLVGALREKILHTVSGARQAQTSAERAELMRRNVNMFLNGLGLDASMIE